MTLNNLYKASIRNANIQRYIIYIYVISYFRSCYFKNQAEQAKYKDHVKHLQRRIKLWLDGDIEALLDEGECIQKRLSKSTTPQSNDVIARTFRSLMLQGKVQSALRYISRNSNGGVLKLDDLIPVTTKEGESIQQTTREILKKKHPIGKDPVASSLIDGEPETVNPITFDGLDEYAIRHAALHTHGAAGPSGLDAYAWRRLCSSFMSASNSLCIALADIGRRIATTNVNPEGLSAFVACRLIPLDKCPGVRPIGVGEVPRRIIAKAILRVIGSDVVDAAGPFQLCAGQDGGCEAAVHAMRSIFQTPDTEAVLLVDANNAFNSLNRQAALHNISIICPSLATTLTNTYRTPVRMYVTGDGEIASTEGTTQRDPVAMTMYALAIKPLIDKLRAGCPDVHQAWYADDATGASTCTGLRKWWDELTDHGPSFGYYPNDSKTYLVVKPEFENVAKDAFAGTDVRITTHGKRHLGAAIGSKTFTEEYVGNKVHEWTNDIMNLARIASSQTHAAYAAYIHGLSNRWSYLLRRVREIEDLIQPLEDAIHMHLIPALTGRPPCSSIERDLLSLPVRLGGLGLRDPSTMASACFQSSQRITASLVALIICQDENETVDCNNVRTVKSEINRENLQRQDEHAEMTYNQLTPEMKRCVELSREKGSSSWLSVLPLEEHGLYLHKGEFRDALCLRYGWKVNNTPQTCNCGAQFTVNHAMICHMGGFPTIRHKEIRDLTASLLTEVCSNVATEPALQPLSGEHVSSHSQHR